FPGRTTLTTLLMHGSGEWIASMGPAVSRPDDRWNASDRVLSFPLQWGRPFRGRMTVGGDADQGPEVLASMGPAVSRPDDPVGLVPTSGPSWALQWGRPF